MMASRHYSLARTILRRPAPFGLRTVCLTNFVVSTTARLGRDTSFVGITRRFTSSSLRLSEVPEVPQEHNPPSDIPLHVIPAPSSQSLIDSLSAALAAQPLDLHTRLGLLRVLHREGQYAKLVKDYEALALRGDGLGEDILFHKEAGEMYDSALKQLGMETKRAEAKARREVLGIERAEGAQRVPDQVRLMGSISEEAAAVSAASIPQPLHIFRPQTPISPPPGIDTQRYLSDIFTQIQRSADPVRRRLLGRATPRTRRDLLTKFVPPEARLKLTSRAGVVDDPGAQHPWLHDDIGVAVRSTNDLTTRLQRVLDLNLSSSALQSQSYPRLVKWYEVEGGLDQLLGAQEGWHAEEESAVVTSYLAHLANKFLGDPANFTSADVASPSTGGDNERVQPAHWSRVPGSPDLLLEKEGENVALLQWVDPVYGDEDCDDLTPRFGLIRSPDHELFVNRLCNGHGTRLRAHGITRNPLLTKLWASMHHHRTRLGILHDGTSSMIVRLASPFCLEVSKVIDRHSMDGFPPPAGHLPHPHVHSWTTSPAKDLIPEVNVLSAMVAMGMDTSRLATKGLKSAEDMFLGVAHYSCDDTDNMRALIKVDVRRDDRPDVDDDDISSRPLFPDRVITKNLSQLSFQRVPETRRGPLAPHISLVKPIGSGRTWDAYEGIMSNTNVQRKGGQKATLTVAGDMIHPSRPLDPSSQTRVAIKLTEIEWFDRARDELARHRGRSWTTREAKLAVLNEARIYQDDLASLQGFALPKFYGLWKAKVAGKEYYAIVLELVGRPVVDSPFGRWDQVTDDERIAIFKAYSAIHRKGICHADVELRHLRYPLPPPAGDDSASTSPSSTREDALRLRVIDFEGSVRILSWHSDYRKQYIDSEKKRLARDLGAEEDVWDAYKSVY
ncbi:hypothetical protein IAT38_004026 [Cryptococcus sp. DSM 104549]